MRAGNLSTSLRLRARANPMAAFDALPRDARRWLAQACLPWSPRSVRRLWARAIVEARGDARAARARLDAAEARHLARDAAAVWGPRHPGAAASDPQATAGRR